MGADMPDHRTNYRPERFIIWASSFRDTDGGAIALHLLCDRLNQAGETALVWPAHRPLIRFPVSLRMVWRALRYALVGRHKAYSVGPFQNRLASRKDIPGSIVVYPEIVAGNPLGGKRVVRWLLHKPGYHTGRVQFGPDELYFYVIEAFADDSLGSGARGKLNLKWISGFYREEEGVRREGSCYMMRKGVGRPISHDLTNSVCLDGLSHEEVAIEFKRRKYFYCYDLYTMYTMYASMCGCIPIIVPASGVSRSDWHQQDEYRYGQAYGEDDIEWALSTRDKLRDLLFKDRRKEENIMISEFIDQCKEWYHSG